MVKNGHGRTRENAGTKTIIFIFCLIHSFHQPFRIFLIKSSDRFTVILNLKNKSRTDQREVGEVWEFRNNFEDKQRNLAFDFSMKSCFDHEGKLMDELNFFK